MTDYYKITVVLKSGYVIKGNVNDDNDSIDKVFEDLLRSMKGGIAGHFNVGATFINVQEIASVKIARRNRFLGWLLT